MFEPFRSQRETCLKTRARGLFVWMISCAVLELTPRSMQRTDATCWSGSSLNCSSISRARPLSKLSPLGSGSLSALSVVQQSRVGVWDEEAIVFNDAGEITLAAEGGCLSMHRSLFVKPGGTNRALYVPLARERVDMHSFLSA